MENEKKSCVTLTLTLTLLPFGMLGASPDGMLLHDMKLTVVEIKCPFPFQPNDKHGFRYVVLPFYCMSTQQRSNV